MTDEIYIHTICFFCGSDMTISSKDTGKDNICDDCSYSNEEDNKNDVSNEQH